MIGLQGIVHGLESYGFDTCYTLKDVMVLRKSFLMYVSVCSFLLVKC